MKTTERFNTAVRKLYTAYHNNELDAMDCKHCAVGNLCDNSDAWAKGFGGRFFGSFYRIPDDHQFNNPSGYSNTELREIESIFIYGIPDKYKNDNVLFKNIISNCAVSNRLYAKKEQKELQFKGLCAVIKYLAQLDNIPNPFNFDNLFNDDMQVANKELELVYE